MLSKISGFLLMATVNGCFLLFFYNTQHTPINAQSTRPQKQETLNMCTLTWLFEKIIVLKQAIKT